MASVTRDFVSYPILLLTHGHNEGAKVVASDLIVFHVLAIAPREGATLPAPAVHRLISLHKRVLREEQAVSTDVYRHHAMTGERVAFAPAIQARSGEPGPRCFPARLTCVATFGEAKSIIVLNRWRVGAAGPSDMRRLVAAGRATDASAGVVAGMKAAAEAARPRRATARAAMEIANSLITFMYAFPEGMHEQEVRFHLLLGRETWSQQRLR
jgi:hypothetical protein